MTRRLGPLARYAVLTAFLVVGGYPLLWMVLSALRPHHEIEAAPFALPLRPRLGNLADVLANEGFGRAYLNSTVVVVSSLLLVVVASSLAAYAFARLRFRGKEFLFFGVLAGMMIPVHVTLIPLNRLLGRPPFALKDTYPALVGPYVAFALPISILLLRGAFEGVPRELEEAARMDGCSAFGVFWRVALPLVRPTLAAVVIFNFLTMWNEFAFALTLINDTSMYTLPRALKSFADEAGVDMGRTSAALCVTVVPMLVLYAAAQKHIISGLTRGALKQ